MKIHRCIQSVKTIVEFCEHYKDAMTPYQLARLHTLKNCLRHEDEKSDVMSSAKFNRAPKRRAGEGGITI